MRRLLAVLSLLCVTAGPAGTWGQTPGRGGSANGREQAKHRAQTLLVKGNHRLRQGLYLEALELFRQAYAVYPSPKLHFNIAQTLNELGRPLEALQHYEQFVHDVPRAENPEQWSLAHERIFKLQGTIATLQIQANVTDAQVTADGQPVGRTPLEQPMRFMPGPHAVVVSKPGYEQQVIELSLKAGEAVTRRVALLTEGEGAATRRIVQRAEAERRAAQDRLRRAQEQEVARRQQTRRVLRIAGWTLLGAGLALAATGGVFGVLARHESTTVEDAAVGTPWTSLREHYDRAETYRRVLYSGVAIGGALAAGGGVLLALGYRSAGAERPPRVTAAPAVGAGQAGVVIAGRF